MRGPANWTFGKIFDTSFEEVIASEKAVSEVKSIRLVSKLWTGSSVILSGVFASLSYNQLADNLDFTASQSILDKTAEIGTNLIAAAPVIGTLVLSSMMAVESVRMHAIATDRIEELKLAD